MNLGKKTPDLVSRTATEEYRLSDRAAAVKQQCRTACLSFSTCYFTWLRPVSALLREALHSAQGQGHQALDGPMARLGAVRDMNARTTQLLRIETHLFKRKEDGLQLILWNA